MALAHNPRIVTDGLVLCLDAANSKSYPGSGTTWYDLSGNGNNGTLVNGTSYDSGNKGRFSFDDTNDYISVSTGYTGSTWTLLLWHLNSGPSSFATVGHRTFASTNTFRFQWDDNNTTAARGPFVDFTSGSGGGSAMFSNGGLGPSDIFNNWILVGLISDTSLTKTTYNTSTTGQSSTLAASRAFSTNGNMSIGINNLSGIGGTDLLNRDGGSVYVPTCMLYNRALTANEVAQNFAALRGRYGI